MLQTELLKHFETIWELPDEGIWEVRGPRRHFTHSKVMAWVAFDRGSRALSNLALSGRSIIGGACANVSTMICQYGFDVELGAFTQSYGVKQLDARIKKAAKKSIKKAKGR